MLKRAGGGAGSPGFGGASSGGNHVPTAPPKLPPKKPTRGSSTFDCDARVGLSPVFGAFLLAIAAVDFPLCATGGGNVQLLARVGFGFGGVTYLLGPLLVVDDNVVELKNPLGMTMRALPFERLEIRGRSLFVTHAGETRKVNGLLARKRDWQALAKSIAEDAS